MLFKVLSMNKNNLNEAVCDLFSDYVLNLTPHHALTRSAYMNLNRTMAVQRWSRLPMFPTHPLKNTQAILLI